MTTHEVLCAAGLKSSKTLTRWRQRGLIPAPEIAPYPPPARGMIGWYPRSTIARVQDIARLQRRGYSLAAICDLLGVT